MENGFESGLKIALQRFKEESDRRESLDTKASLVLSFAGILAGLLFNVLSDTLERQPSDSLGIPAFVLLLLGFVSILISAFFSLAALWIGDYRAGPGGSILFRASETRPRPELEKKLLGAYASAFQCNWRVNQRKATMLRLGFLSITVGTSLVSAALLVFVIRQRVL